jgi:hypothetical protein
MNNKKYFDFVEEVIKKLGPMKGYYVIYDDNYSPIFAGESNNIREDLLRHLNKESIESECIFKNNPAYFLGGPNLSADKLEDIIRELNPKCNREYN